MHGYTIRTATRDDLLQVRRWLEQEELDGIDGSFYCNYHQIECGQRDGSLVALVRDADSFAVAFCLGDAGAGIGILAVKADLRSRGLGSFLARHFIDSACARDAIGLVHQCAPTASRPFWLSLGFVSVPSPSDDGNPNWVALALPREHALPDGCRHKVEVAFEDTEDHMRPVFQCEAALLDGHYVLARDFVQYAPNPDLQLEVRCDGERVYDGKSKYVTQVGGERARPWVRVRHINTSGQGTP